MPMADNRYLADIHPPALSISQVAPRPLSPLGAARCLRPSSARGWGEANLRASWDLAGHAQRQLKSPPALRETLVPFLGGEDALEKG